jgi:hypothetical protein
MSDTNWEEGDKLVAVFGIFNFQHLCWVWLHLLLQYLFLCLLFIPEHSKFNMVVLDSVGIVFKYLKKIRLDKSEKFVCTLYFLPKIWAFNEVYIILQLCLHEIRPFHLRINNSLLIISLLLSNSCTGGFLVTFPYMHSSALPLEPCSQFNSSL